MRIFISLGSNIDPEKNLARAVVELRRHFADLRVSPVYQTPPVGDSDQSDYLNCAAVISSDQTPQAVQEILHQIEASLGRRRDPQRPYGPRTIDLDVVLAEGATESGGALQLPSPLVEKEAFVAVPLADLAPDVVHPRCGLTLATLAAQTLAHSQVLPIKQNVELS